MATLQTYRDRLPGLLNELELMIAEAACLPYMEEQDRRTILASLRQAAHGEAPTRKANPAILKMIGIGVRRHGKS